MKLHAKRRLLVAESGPSNNSVKGFLLKMAMMASGKIPLRADNRDCRATVTRAIMDGQRDGHIVIVGDDGHPIHTFLAHGPKIVADSYSGRWHDGVYSCRLSNGEAVDLKTLAIVSIDDFLKDHVDPIQLHGHVVPRPDGVRAKCGGYPSRLACTVCAAEAELLSAGLHPLIQSKD